MQYVVQVKTPEELVMIGKLTVKQMDQSPKALKKAFNKVRGPIQKVLDRTGGKMIYDARTIGKAGEFRTFMLIEATPAAKTEIEGIEGIHEVRPNRQHQLPKPGR